MKSLLPLLLFCSLGALGLAAEPSKPNVIIILTDDQGYGELGATGNPIVHTPHIDAFARQSVSLTNYNVMPVCSPTRACLMTGRYNYRTGVIDTFLGRSMMYPDEKTLAQMLGAGGYHTGIFGKWHLGDNYPMRAMDKGFQESLVLNGGGLAQPGDAPDPVDERGAYFNATLRHNGRWVKTDGYVSDVITKAAMQYIEQQKADPFFVYLAFNCPHSPHQVPEEYSRHYPAEDFDPSKFPSQGNPMPKPKNPDDLAHVYGMIENIDDNVGRLFAKLDQLKIAENTIVILFSDNGCQQHGGYNAGLRGWKGTTYEGGIHQFCFVRWPQHFESGRTVNQITAHIDLTPTLLDLCKVTPPASVKFDGRSIAPLLRGEKVEWPERTLFFQWHRGDVPEMDRSFAARNQQWKLVQAMGVPDNWKGNKVFQLFDVEHDPYEMHDLAAEKPEIVEKLKNEYHAWFKDVTSARDYTVPSRIYLGAPQENPTLLTRQDARGPAASWDVKGIGYWDVQIVSAGPYDVKVLCDPLPAAGEATLKIGETVVHQPMAAGATECHFRDLRLSVGPGRVEPKFSAGSETRGATYLEFKRLD